MKKIALIVTMVALACGGMFAQASAPTAPATTLTAVQVSGTLAWINGHIGIKDGGKTYYVAGIQRLLGFVDGLKEGSSVKVEGYPMTNSATPEYVFLRATKITFNGKEYALDRAGNCGMMGRETGFGKHDRDGMMNGSRSGRGWK